jgi:hypothetical protein
MIQAIRVRKFTLKASIHTFLPQKYYFIKKFQCVLKEYTNTQHTQVSERLNQ